MRKAEDGFPIVARSTSGLGVRVPGMTPPAQKVDVDVDANGDVILNDKGMSVNPRWKDILPNFLPMRCGGFAPNNRFCFKMGDGPFVKGAFATGLELIPDSPNHGVVAPDQTMLLADYQAHIAATRLLWQIDES
jgi:hypothetical protein